MEIQNVIKLFEDSKIRSVWDEEDEELWLSVIDVIQALTDTDNPRRYWSDLKHKLKDEGNQLYEKIVQLKLESSDGKWYLTDVANPEQILRIIQSVPSKKAEPFKRWLAQIGSERLDIEARAKKRVASELSTREIQARELPGDDGALLEESGAYKNNIAVLRRMRGFSQVYMAQKLGVARQTYINIEKGLKELTISQVEILKETLQVSFDDLLGTDTGNESLDYRKFL